MRQVITSIEISVPPAVAIRAFLDPAMLRGWWGVERSLVEPKQNGLYTLAWAISEAGIRYISTGTIVQVDLDSHLFIGNMVYLNPDRSFIGPQELELTATETGKGCLLTIRQGPYPEGAGEDWDWYYEAVKHAWPQVIQTLKAYLESNLHQR